MIGVPVFVTIVLVSALLVGVAWALAVAKGALTEIAIVSAVSGGLLLAVLGLGAGSWISGTPDHGDAVRCANADDSFALAAYDAGEAPCPADDVQYHYCEAFYTRGLRQPINTISDLGFVVSSVWIALLMGIDRRRRAARGRADDRGPRSLMVGSTPVTWTYVLVVALMGPGSMALHASMKAWGGFLDAMTVLLWAALGFCWTASRFARAWGWADRTSRTATFAGIWLLLCGLAGVVGEVTGQIGVFQFVYGGLFFLVEILYQAIYQRRDWGWTFTAVGVIAVAILPFWVFTGSGFSWALCDPRAGPRATRCSTCWPASPRSSRT